MRSTKLLRRFFLSLSALAIFLTVAIPVHAKCSKQVILYNASWCPYCRQVRAILQRNDIRYTIRDATTPSVQAEMIKRFGDAAVPRTVIGRSVVAGVDEARIKRLCW